MKNTFIPFVDGFNRYMNEEEFDLVKKPGEILNELLHCKEHGNAIGVHSPVLGDTIVITGVEDIILEEADAIIVFKPYDSTGYILPSNKLSLHDIVAVCPLKSPIKNPYLENLEKEKNWFFDFAIQLGG